MCRGVQTRKPPIVDVMGHRGGRRGCGTPIVGGFHAQRVQRGAEYEKPLMKGGFSCLALAEGHKINITHEVWFFYSCNRRPCS